MKSLKSAKKIEKNVQIDQLKQQLKEKEQELDILKLALELAAKEAPLHCPNPSEYYNAQDEYGSDEPYFIQENACEFEDSEMCIDCQINHFYQLAKKQILFQEK